MKKFSDLIDTSLAPPLLLALMAFVAALPLFTPGWFWTHEEFSPLWRVIALAEEMRAGDLYPRWLSASYLGKGSPFFNFYSPALHFIAAALYAAGLPILASIKIILGLLFFAGAWGMFLWVRRHAGLTGGMIAAILYLFVPYHFVDLYVRGAFAEFSALAAFPWVFIGIDRIIDEPDRSLGIIATACSTAALLLCHQLSALMIAPFAVLYGFDRLRHKGFSMKRFGKLCLALFIAAGLSAFYWLPVIAEKKYLKDFSAALTTGGYNYANHFVWPSQWVSLAWGFGASVPGQADGMSFQIGPLLLICAVITFGVSFFMKKNGRRFALLTGCLGLAGVFLTSDYSSFIYRTVPALPMIQFPWRFLGPATLFLAASGGALGSLAVVERFKLLFIVILSVLLLFLSRDQRALNLPNVPISDLYATSMMKMQWIGSANAEDEYLPIWADRDIVYQRIDIRPLAHAGDITGVTSGGKKMAFVFTGIEPMSLVSIPWFYYPGWQAMVDGVPAPLATTPEGFICVSLPAGEHAVRVSFESTWPRKTGWTLALLSLSSLAVWSVYRVRKDR